MATMNMDVACAVDENGAKYVIAAGQDDVISDKIKLIHQLYIFRTVSCT